MSTESIIPGILIGLLSYSSLYCGKGIQKYAINGIQAKKSLKTKHSGIWIFGTVLTALPVFIQWAALLYAPVHIIASLEGVGLIVLLVFSYFVLKERIVVREFIGSAGIVIGLVLIAYFNTSSREVVLEDVNPVPLVIVFLPLVVLQVTAILISRSKGYIFAGPLFGFTAGTMMAFQTFSKRLSFIPELTLAGVAATFVFAPLTLIVTQIGFTKADANKVVPAFTSASILIATLMGTLILSEHVVITQVAGIVILLVGVVLITLRKPEQKPVVNKTSARIV